MDKDLVLQKILEQMSEAGVLKKKKNETDEDGEIIYQTA